MLHLLPTVLCHPAVPAEVRRFFLGFCHQVLQSRNRFRCPSSGFAPSNSAMFQYLHTPMFGYLCMRASSHVRLYPVGRAGLLVLDGVCFVSGLTRAGE
jgi:hypothetical protein